MSDLSEIISKDAYVLYYKRKDFYPDTPVDFESIKIAPDFDPNQVPDPEPIQQQIKKTATTLPDI